MDPGASGDDLLIERTDAEFRHCYALGQSIGAGGAGEVFLATQVSLARQVVIKVMQRALVADETHRRRFHREARMLSRLSHARITQVFEYGVWEGQPYLVMELVDGGSLASLMERRPRVHTTEALKIAMQTAEGLDYLHQNRILHRDIKPGNILLSSKGDAKIADFGLARPDGESGLTAQGMVVGTLWYIAPELLISEDASPQSDLFSLGMVTYQMLAGRMPFREDVSDVVQLASMRVNEPPLGLQVHRPDLPPQVYGLVNRLLSSDPAARPRSAGELAEELADLHDGVASPSRQLRRMQQSRTHAVREMRTEQLTVGITRPKVIESDSAPTAMRGLKAVTRLAVHTLPAKRMWRWLAIGLVLLIPLGLVAGLYAYRSRTRPAIEQDPDAGPEPGSPLTITRSPRWVKARMVTVKPAKLVVRARPVGEMTGQPIEAESRDLHEHDVDVAPLLPRVTYEIEARLVLPSGEAQNLGTRIAESPLESLMALASEVERLRLHERLEQLDKARPRRHPPKLEEVLALIEPARFKVRADALAPFVDEIWADPAVRSADRWRIYKGLEPLRLLDRYCEAHQLTAATGVERLLPPDLAWGTRPIGTPEPVRANALAASVQGQPAELLMPGDPASELLVDMGDLVNAKHRPGGERAPDKIVKELVVGAMHPRRAQLKLVVRNVRSVAFAVSIDALEETITLAAPYAKGLSGESVALYHTIPTEWVKPGTWKATIRGRVVPGAYDNRRPLGIANGIDNPKNYPQFEEIALLASE